jgi:hypothetical protein
MVGRRFTEEKKKYGDPQAHESNKIVKHRKLTEDS